MVKSIKSINERPVSSNKVTLAILYALILLIVVVISHLFIQREEAKVNSQFHANFKIESELNNLLSNLQDAETGQRGYLLTLNDDYLKPYSLAVEKNEDLFNVIEQGLENESHTVERFQKLRQLSKNKLDELEQTITYSKSGEYDKAIDLVNTDEGKLLMDSIRIVIQELRNQEKDALFKNSADLKRYQKVSVLVVSIAAIIIIGIFFYIYLFVHPLFEKIKRRNEVIVKNQELLELKNKELEHFAYITSHDLKEPSRTISGFIDAFEEDFGDKVDETAQSYLQFIKGASQRMNEMISSILSFSRLGTSEPFTKIDLNETLQEINQDLELLKSENNASISSEDLPVITAKSSLIKLLLQNLITNAIKFRKKEIPPIINISFNEKPYTWEFFVTDNGIGIPLKQQAKIFNFFTKLHLPSEYEGQGIGLAFCKKIVEIHQGSIGVDSVSGEGCTFKFTILKNLSNDK